MAKSAELLQGTLDLLILRPLEDIQSAGEPKRIPAVWAERGLFRMLGAEPLLGRIFREGDPLNVVVLSEGLWKGHFGGEPSCAGRYTRSTFR